MLELIDLTDWKTKKEIQSELLEKGVKKNERTLRLKVEEHNYKYAEGESEDFIAHSPKGYKRTTNDAEILESIADYKKRAFDQLKKASRYMKALGQSYNLKLELEELLENSNN